MRRRAAFGRPRGLAWVQILAGGSRVGWSGGEGVASYWLFSPLQDSDGDKSDDLVVDVSNEVRRAGPDCGVSLGLGV